MQQSDAPKGSAGRQAVVLPRGGWHRFTARAALAAAIAEIGLLTVALMWFLPASASETLSEEYGELVAAASSPGMYRLLATLDVAVWLGLGAVIIGLAALVFARVPVAGAVLGACGAGQALGTAGAFTRLEAVGGIVRRHGDAALVDQQALDAFLVTQDVLLALFNTGALLWGAAFLVAAWATWQVTGFPRWLSMLLGVLGLVAAADLVIYFTTGSFALDLVKFPLLPIIFVACAVALWRPPAGALA